MATETDDHWQQWLRAREHSDDAGRQRQAAMLREFRDRVLDGADPRSGDHVLDVGAGDGLVGFGALPRIGPDGRVVLGDVSADLLDEARAIAGELGVGDRCGFIRGPVQSLPVADGTVDAVTARSVLIYVADKTAALSECHRVLAPGGRLSVLEPLHSFWADVDLDRNACLGYDASGVPDLAAAVSRVLGAEDEWDFHIDFGAPDLFDAARRAGFASVDLTVHATEQSIERAECWETFLDSTPNPLATTLRAAMAEALSSAERREFEAHLRPRVESADVPRRRLDAMVHLRATCE